MSEGLVAPADKVMGEGRVSALEFVVIVKLPLLKSNIMLAVVRSPCTTPRVCKSPTTFPMLLAIESSPIRSTGDWDGSLILSEEDWDMVICFKYSLTVGPFRNSKYSNGGSTRITLGTRIQILHLFLSHFSKFFALERHRLLVKRSSRSG